MENKICSNCNGHGFFPAVGHTFHGNTIACSKCTGAGIIKRLQPTHFIEVFKIKGSTHTVATSLSLMDKLEESIIDSQIFGLETIAIWKIKLKNNNK